MNSTNKVFYSVILTKLLAIGLVAFAATSQAKINPTHHVDSYACLVKQSLALNQAHDANPSMQTVVISAKRLAREAELATDTKQSDILLENAKFNRMLRKTA